MKTAKRRRTSQ